MEQSIYLMDLDGNNLRRMAHDLFDFAFAWSPDGSAILYTVWGDSSAELFHLDITSGDIRQLTYNSLDENFAQWSPDGSRIAVVLLGDFGSGLYVMSPDGSHLRALTDQVSWSFLPSFSWRPQ
jgi:TolB protein